jgi:hypothetical protein
MRTPINFPSVFLCATLLMLTGCASETLFRSDFDQTPAGQPPSATQAIGTAAIDGLPGSVTVIDPPVLPSGKWVQISRPTGPSTAGFQGKFSQFRGEGVYTFSATLFIPPNAGVATVQFEPNTNGPSDLSAFLHLDFMPDTKFESTITTMRSSAASREANPSSSKSNSTSSP